VDSITEKDKAEKACAVEGRGFEGNCASSWVSRPYSFSGF
jgi:cytochrome c oxidase assembly factor 6